MIVTCFLLRDQQLTIGQLHNDGCRLPRLNNQGDASFATCELAEAQKRGVRAAEPATSSGSDPILAGSPGAANRLLAPCFNGEWADLDEFMMVLVVTPIASLTVPIAVVIMMPVIIIPVVIPMILVSRRGERGSDEGSKHGKSYQYPFHACF